MAKRGFYPPKNFEENIADFVVLMTDSSKPWAGKVPGNVAADTAALNEQLQKYVPIRQKFEQMRLAYESAKEVYVGEGRALWERFFTGLEHARTYSKKDSVLATGLEKYKRSYRKSTPPSTPGDQPE